MKWGVQDINILLNNSWTLGFEDKRNSKSHEWSPIQGLSIFFFSLFAPNMSLTFFHGYDDNIRMRWWLLFWTLPSRVKPFLVPQHCFFQRGLATQVWQVMMLSISRLVTHFFPLLYEHVIKKI